MTGTECSHTAQLYCNTSFVLCVYRYLFFFRIIKGHRVKDTCILPVCIFEKESLQRSEHLGKEIPEPRILRIIEKLFRRVLFLDHSFIDKKNPRTDFAGESHLMGDDCHRHT